MAKKKAQVNPEETKREKFVRLVELRTSKAVRSIELIGNCFGSSYEYTQADWTKISTAILKAHEQLGGRFTGGGKPASGFKL